MREVVRQWERIGGKPVKGLLIRHSLLGEGAPRTQSCWGTPETQAADISELFFQGSGEEPVYLSTRSHPSVVKCCSWGINPPALLVHLSHGSNALQQRNRTWDRKPLMCVESEPQQCLVLGEVSPKACLVLSVVFHFRIYRLLKRHGLSNSALRGRTVKS